MENTFKQEISELAKAIKTFLVDSDKVNRSPFTPEQIVLSDLENIIEEELGKHFFSDVENDEVNPFLTPTSDDLEDDESNPFLTPVSKK